MLKPVDLEFRPKGVVPPGGSASDCEHAGPALLGTDTAFGALIFGICKGPDESRGAPSSSNVIFGEKRELGMATMTPKRHTTSTWQSPLMLQGLPAAAKAHHPSSDFSQHMK